MRTYLSIVPPGEYYTKIHILHGMSFLAGVELAYQDSDGKNWIRNGLGIIKQINVSPSEYYSLPLPLAWEMPIGKIS